jgi:hypothetical protein
MPKALPKNVITGLHLSRRTPNPTNVLEDPTLPRSCARKLWDGNLFVCSKLCSVLVISTRGTNPDEVIYKSSRVSQEPRVRRGRGAGASRSRSALTLMGTLRIKKEVENLSRPVLSRHCRRPSVRPAGSARHDTHARTPPACHTTPTSTPTAWPGRRQRQWRARVASFCLLLNFSIGMEQSPAYKLSLSHVNYHADIICVKPKRY